MSRQQQARVITSGGSTEEAGRVAGAIDHLVPVDFSMLNDEVDGHDDWLVEPILPARRSVSIVAKAGVGKSLLALDLAASLATGRQVCGRPAGDPVHVVYVDMEMTYDDLAERLEDLGYDYTNDADLHGHLHYYLMAEFEPFDTAAGGDQLLAVANRHQASVVFIDTLARVVEGKENDADTYRSFDHHAGKRLKAAGMTVARLDHEGKTKNRGARGSSAKRDDVDVEWRLSINSAGSVILDLEKGRSRLIPATIILNRESDPLRHVVHRPALTSKQLELIRHLDALGIDVDMSRRKAKELLKRAGVRFTNADFGPAQQERAVSRWTAPPDHPPVNPMELLQDKARTTPTDHHGPPEHDESDQRSPPRGDRGPSPEPGHTSQATSGDPRETQPAGNGAKRSSPTWVELMDRAT